MCYKSCRSKVYSKDLCVIRRLSSGSCDFLCGVPVKSRVQPGTHRNQPGTNPEQLRKKSRPVRSLSLCRGFIFCLGDENCWARREGQLWVNGMQSDMLGHLPKVSTKRTVIRLHMGVALTGGQIKRENPGFWGSGQPRAAGKPLKMVGGFAPHLFEVFPGRPGSPRPQKSRTFPLNLAPC